MRCYVCGKTYFEKRTIKTLFTTQPSYRCQSCLKKYQLHPSYQVIPKERGCFHIIGLFYEHTTFDLMAFTVEIAYIIDRVLKLKKRHDPLLWIDKLDADLLGYLDNLDDDIYIITTHIYL